MNVARSRGGLPVPSLGLLVVFAVALAAAWAIWKTHGRAPDQTAPRAAENPVENLQSIEAFVRQGAAAVPAFTAALDSPDPLERSRAAYGLGGIGPEARDSLPRLAERLTDVDARVREKALAAIVRISSDKGATAGFLAPRLADPETRVRETAGKELLAMGPLALPHIIAVLQTGEPATRLEALRVIRRVQPSPPAASQYSTTNQRFHPAWRSVSPSLRTWGAVQTELDEAIRSALADTDPAVRLEALGCAAEHGLATADDIRELLHCREPANVSLALAILPGLEDSAVQFLPDVMALFDDEAALATDKVREISMGWRQGRRYELLQALRAMKSGARPAIPRLVEVAERRRDYVCVLFAEALASIGADDAEIRRVLEPVLLSDNRNDAWSAGVEYVRHNSEAARRHVSLLLPRLGNNETGVDKSILYALYSLGSVAQEAIPQLIPLLENKDDWVAEFTAHALQSMGSRAEPAQSGLASVVANPRRPIRQRVASANSLANIGTGAQRAIPALLKVCSEPEASGKVPRDNSINQLDSDWGLRIAAIQALGRIGGDDPGLIPGLQSQLASRSAQVRVAAVKALGSAAYSGRSSDSGAQRQSQAAALIAPLLEDSDASVQATVANMLDRMGPKSLPAILEALRSRQPALRLSAVRVLRSTESRRSKSGLIFRNADEETPAPNAAPLDNPAWVSVRAAIDDAIRGAVADRDADVRLEAIRCAAERGVIVAAEVRELLHSTDANDLNLALLAVEGLEDSSVQLLPDVMGLFDDETTMKGSLLPGDTIRLWHLLHALSAMKTGARSAIPTLLEVANRRREYNCVHIARTLDAIGADDLEIDRILVPLLEADNDLYVRVAGQWLARYKPHSAQRHVAKLLEKLETVESGVDKPALYALWSLGAAAQEGVPALIPLLDSQDRWVSEFAALTLGSIGPAAATAVPDLENIVVNPHKSIAQRRAAAIALANIGPAAQGSLPALLKIIEGPELAGSVSWNMTCNSEWNLRCAAIRALCCIEGDHSKSIPVLRSQLASRSPDVRTAAVQALGQVGVNFPEVLSDLVERLDDDDPYTQAQAALAIGRLHVDRTMAVAPLTEFLDDERPPLRIAAAMALREIGTAAGPALPALRKTFAAELSLSAGKNLRGKRPYVVRGDPLNFSMSAAQAIQSAIDEIESELQAESRR
ncbi:MAG: HEAT repeat domain-containing protein [Planctomycetia bacterium]|nr:HEAT repeat domain-containing protein [Planctomycetia bacterium]